MAIVGSAAVIFALGLATPTGIVEWVLYLIPVTLAIFSWSPSIPLLVAGTVSTLTVLGYFLSPSGRFHDISEINRAFGVLTFWAVAFAGRQSITGKIAVRNEEWLRAGESGLMERLQGNLRVGDLAERTLEFLATYLEAPLGALYAVEPGSLLHRLAGYAAIPIASSGPELIQPGEGLVGQAFMSRETLIVRDVPGGYATVSSGLGEHRPLCLVLVPASISDAVYAVVELGFFREPGALDLELLRRVEESVAVALRSARYREQVQSLLDETQRQAEELQAQEEQLRVANEELENQQRELEESNQSLESQAERLEEQKAALLTAQEALTGKAADLARISDYKSEFLANMSHELRTPLNSSLILTKLLIENREGNLTEEQVRFAQTIHNAGNDLLFLINDILDLAKIEAGKMTMNFRVVTIERLTRSIADVFEPMATSRGIGFSIDIDPSTPAALETDEIRLQQILKNLLSNALKFTEKGSVRLRTCADDDSISFAVKDTGTGIPREQQAMIFEAFRQLDSTASRRHGGTGLGLSISRELAGLLGGDLSVESAPGAGSTFTLRLPRESGAHLSPPSQSPPSRPAAASPPRPALLIEDDRRSLSNRERLLLVIEDDPAFAQILFELAHDLDFQCVVAGTADDGLALAERLSPSGILLDVRLPDHSGLLVLEHLKRNPVTRHVPIHVVSVDDHTARALSMGAVGYVRKPVEREGLIGAIRKLEQTIAPGSAGS